MQLLRSLSRLWQSGWVHKLYQPFYIGQSYNVLKRLKNVLSYSVSSSRLVCYFTNWSQYRPGNGRFMPSNIDPNLCTHLIYAFSGINEANELVTIEWNDEELYRSFNGLKQRLVYFLLISLTKCWEQIIFAAVSLHSHRNPNLKTLLAVGGWNFGTQKCDTKHKTIMNHKFSLYTDLFNCAFLLPIGFIGSLLWCQRKPKEIHLYNLLSNYWENLVLMD